METNGKENGDVDAGVLIEGATSGKGDQVDYLFNIAFRHTVVHYWISCYSDYYYHTTECGVV